MKTNRVQFQAGLSMVEFMDRYVRPPSWGCRAAMHLLTRSENNVAALELMRHLGVCYKTAWLVKHKLMEVMRMREDARQLEGRVEIDDADLGGERSGGKEHG